MLLGIHHLRSCCTFQVSYLMHENFYVQCLRVVSEIIALTG